MRIDQLKKLVNSKKLVIQSYMPKKHKKKQPTYCCCCHLQIKEDQAGICACHYHRKCIKNVIKNAIKYNPSGVKIDSFDHGDYSISCPKCSRVLNFKTQLIKRKCEWCHEKSYYSQIKPMFIFSILAFFFCLILLGFTTYIVWAHQNIFQLTDWRKYLLISSFLFAMVLAIVRVIINTYYALGTWIENKIVLKDRDKKQRQTERTVIQTIAFTESMTNRTQRQSKKSQRSFKTQKSYRFQKSLRSQKSHKDENSFRTEKSRQDKSFKRNKSYKKEEKSFRSDRSRKEEKSFKSDRSQKVTRQIEVEALELQSNEKTISKSRKRQPIVYEVNYASDSDIQ